MLLRLFCVCTLVFGPATSLAAVSITEVAWMGDTTSANNEWIELHNDGEAVSVDGWQLADGMNLTITLSGTIPARSYVLLERNRASGLYLTTPPFVVYTGALVNTGATLTLKRADGALVDQVAGGEGWVTIGGDNITKETAQYTTAGWRTGAPTPAAPNTATSAPPPPPPPPSTTTTSTTTTPPTTNPPASTAAGSGTTRGSSRPSETVRLVIPNVDLTLTTDIQSTAYVNQPIVMRVTPRGLGPTWLASLSYEWNFGDLATSSLQNPIHRYRYPGTYMVTVRAEYGRHAQVAMHTITVLPVTAALVWTSNGDIQVQNNAPYEVDMSYYRLASAEASVLFPNRTIMPPRSTITLPATRLGAAYGASLWLRDRAGSTVAVWPLPALETASAVSDDTTAAAEVEAATVSVIETPSPVLSPVSMNPVTPTPLLAALSAPLVLRPVAEDTALMPEYVLRALAPAVVPGASPGLAFHWTYAVLVFVIAGAIWVVLATSKKVSLTEREIVTFR